MFGSLIIIVEVFNYYNLPLIVIKLFESSDCLPCFLSCYHHLSYTKILCTSNTNNYNTQTVITTN
uniref:Uncharacterized protein n=1 Tax=Cucumis melo TaxID=3656 RepID=A0A9I9E6P2_CUCME